MIPLAFLMIGAILPILYGIGSYSRRSRTWQNRLVLIITVFLSMTWSFSVLVLTAGSDGEALEFYSLEIAVGWCGVGTVLLLFFLSTYFPSWFTNRRVTGVCFALWAGLAASILIDTFYSTHVFFSGLAHTNGARAIIPGTLPLFIPGLILIGSIIIILPLILAIRRWPSNRGEPFVFLFGIILPVGLFVGFGAVPGIPEQLSPLLALLLVVFLAFGFNKNRPMNVRPKREKTFNPKAFEDEPVGIGLQQHHSYLLETANPDRLMIIFSEQVRKGLQGLCVTRTNPSELRHQYVLKETPMIWLTELPGEFNIDGGRLERLVHTLIRFIHESEDSIIVIEGLSYLVALNGFEPVLKMLQDLRDHVSEHNARLIIKMNPKLHTERERSFFEHELERFSGYAYENRRVTGYSLKVYLDFVKERCSGEHIDDIIDQAELPEMHDPGYEKRTFPAEYSILLRNAIRRYYETEDFRIAYEFGRFMVMNADFIRRVIIKAVSMESCLKILQRTQKKISTFGTIEFERENEKKFIFRLRGTSGDIGFCEFVCGCLDGLLELKRIPGTVVHNKCIFRGDELDEYLISLE